ncbi:MAG: hypothetical protein R3B84_19030 [Zavarzinella sp.]
MSFSAHKRDALDPTLPLNYRMSHVRSCAMLMGHKYRVHRDVVIDRVRELCGVDVRIVGTEEDAVKAVTALIHIKSVGLDVEPDNRAG